MRHSCPRFTAVNLRQAHSPSPHKTSAIAALTLGLTAVLQTPVTRATAPYKCAPTDERLGMNGGDPVCRLFQLSLSGFRSLLGLRCQPLGAELLKAGSGHSRRRGTIISGRFRGRKLVGSGRYSKCFFAGAPSAFCGAPSAFLPGPNASRSCPFSCNEGAWPTVKVGVRR